MRVGFMGASWFGLRCLERIIVLPEIEVVGIVTNPETFIISYRPEGVKNVLHADFYPVAKQYDIPVWLMREKMADPALVDQVNEWEPDLLLVVGWYHMVPKVLRNIAQAVGLHSSLLPDYSGGAPLVWAMINGEQKTGISLFVLEDGVDSGDIIGQKEEPIYDNDTIATLYARIEKLGIALLEAHLPKIARGEATYTRQDESKRRIMPQRSPEDGKIDWNWPAVQIYNFVRAQTKPYPGAFTYLDQEKLILWKVRVAEHEQQHDTIPGSVVWGCSMPESFGVWAGDGRLLCVHEVGFTDGSTMTGRGFFTKRALHDGMLLGTSKVYS